MPEGDTIHRTAVVLRRALEGAQLVGFESPLPALRDADLAGRVVRAVRSRGKHLLIVFDDDRTLHTHLGMRGAWHVYGRDDRWRKSHRLARVVLVGVERIAVCFDAKVVELLRPVDMARHPHLEKLGPDLLDADFDEDAVVARLEHRDEPIGELLLDQRVVAGVGNVFKSEILFGCGVNPFALASSLPRPVLYRIVAAARDELRRNARAAVRVTVRRWQTAHRHAVYRRTGERCLVCGTRIESDRQGLSARMSYWCPCCQPQS